MSLKGRYIIDRIKTRVGKWLKLPCPPYGNIRYWEGVYKTLGPHDVYEWGSANLKENLLEYDYQLIEYYSSSAEAPSIINKDTPLLSSTFSEAIGVDPTDTDRPIVLLGCGNSKLGEDMAECGWRGPLIQVDVVSRVLDTMTERCAPLVKENVMDFVQDDATALSAFEDNTVDAVIDKGLVDALFCADDFNQVKGIVNSVHRVLKPGGIFCLFSLSRPEFLMPQLCTNNTTERRKWKDIQVRQLESILLYRLEKADETKQRKGPSRKSLQRKQKSKRQ